MQKRPIPLVHGERLCHVSSVSLHTVISCMWKAFVSNHKVGIACGSLNMNIYIYRIRHDVLPTVIHHVIPITIAFLSSITLAELKIVTMSIRYHMMYYQLQSVRWYELTWHLSWSLVLANLRS